MRLTIAPRAFKAMNALQTSDRERVRVRIEQLAAGAPNLDVKALKGTRNLRLKVGGFRVIFERHGGGLIVVKDVLDRKDAYR